MSDELSKQQIDFASEASKVLKEALNKKKDARKVRRKNMKAISIHQPMANLVACGYKTIEVRPWKHDYRGELLICSTDSGDEPAGVALAVVELVDIRPFEEGVDEEEACCDKDPLKEEYSFVLEWKGLLKHRFEVRGVPSIYNWDVRDKDLSFEDDAGIAAFEEKYGVQ